MQISGDRTRGPGNEVEVEGLPVVRPNVAGIDLGNTKHWVCAPRQDGTGREVEQFGATTPELERMAEWKALECIGYRRMRFWRGTDSK
jgi:hypothetical protein